MDQQIDQLDPQTKVFRVTLESGEAFDCPQGERVLHAMERAHLRTIQVGCRGGGCGACRIEVLSGTFETLRMSKTHISEEDVQNGFVLACRVVPTSDLVLRPAPKPKQPKQSKPEK